MDKSLKKKKIIGYVVFYVIFAALFIYGTIGNNDLEFDKMVFNPSHPFAYFLACFGMLPRYTIQLFGYVTLMAVYRPYEQALDVAESIFGFFKYLRSNKIIHTILAILYKVLFVAFMYGAYMGSNDTLNFILYNAFDANIQDMLVNAGAPTAVAVIVWTVARVLLITVSYFVIKKLSVKHARALEFMAVAALAMYYSDGIITMLKDHFHRIRFREMLAYSNGIVGEDGAVHSLHNAPLTRDMIANTDFHWFDKWYHIGKDDGVVWYDPHSFPSGHTSAASYSFLLVPLFTRSEKLSKYFTPFYIIGVGYTMAVAFSRMMRGAHYMTDVTGAGLIMFTLMLIYVFVLGMLQRYSDKRLQKHK